MATSIVDTLFGVSPERLEQQRAAAADARALAFAKLDPFQQANFAIGRGASGLAGALGGALGGQDPELQRVTMRQQIARQINPRDPATIEQGIVALQQAGDTEGAMLLNSEYQKTQLLQNQIASEQALTAQRLRDKEGVDPLQQLLRTGNFTPPSVAKYKTSQNIADLELVDKTSPLAQERLAALVASRVGPPGTPEYNAAFNASIDKQMQKQPGVVVQTGDQRDKNIFEKVDVPRLQQFTDAASSARALARDAEVIQKLLAGSGGGTLIKLTTDIQRSLGFETERVTANDLANALATRGAVQIRAPGSGATSDLEFKAYVQAFPSLANSEGGRQLMSKYATAFSKRSAKLADHTRKLIRDGDFSEQAIAEYDDSLGPVLDDEFYKFSPGRRPNVPVYTPPAAPAARTATPPARSVNDVLNQYLPN
jgi:hypothetical protein